MIKRLFAVMGIACVAVASAAPVRAAENIPAVVSAAAEASNVACATACFLRSMYVTTGAAAGYVMTFNAAAVPADGAVTPRSCVQVAANSTVALDFAQTAEAYPGGLTVVFSTTGCFTKTASATAFISVRKQ